MESSWMFTKFNLLIVKFSVFYSSKFDEFNDLETLIERV